MAARPSGPEVMSMRRPSRQMAQVPLELLLIGGPRRLLLRPGSDFVSQHRREPERQRLDDRTVRWPCGARHRQRDDARGDAVRQRPAGRDRDARRRLAGDGLRQPAATAVDGRGPIAKWPRAYVDACGRGFCDEHDRPERQRLNARHDGAGRSVVRPSHDLGGLQPAVGSGSAIARWNSR